MTKELYLIQTKGDWDDEIKYTVVEKDEIVFNLKHQEDERVWKITGLEEYELKTEFVPKKHD